MFFFPSFRNCKINPFSELKKKHVLIKVKFFKKAQKCFFMSENLNLFFSEGIFNEIYQLLRSEKVQGKTGNLKLLLL